VTVSSLKTFGHHVTLTEPHQNLKNNPLTLNDVKNPISYAINNVTPTLFKLAIQRSVSSSYTCYELHQYTKCAGCSKSLCAPDDYNTESYK
jgi:hypothetical protein